MPQVCLRWRKSEVRAYITSELRPALVRLYSCACAKDVPSADVIEACPEFS